RAESLVRRRACFREADGAFQEIALDDRVDDAGLFRTRCRHRLPIGTDLERERWSAQPWQTLSSASPGDDSELHFRLADFGRRKSNPKVTSHGELEAATQGMTVNGGDEWFWHILQSLQSCMHRLRPVDGLLTRLQLFKDVDVGTSNKRRPCADQDD